MFAWQATVQNEFGNAVTLPVVTVYEADGVTLADIYNESGDPIDNPVTGTMEGFVQFWANAGQYKIVGVFGGDETAEWSVFLDTPLADAVAAAAAAAAAAEASALAVESADEQTGLDALATAADRVQTGLDAVATAADRVQTGLDAAATDADAIATAADRVQTGLDAAATDADAIATAADRVQTGLDRVATAADRVQTGIDRAATEAAAASTWLMGRNLIINGSGRINQRGYVSGTATSGTDQFTLDRWFVVTSGQNLSFSGNDSARVMTAPAGGARQVVEGANVVGGSYVLNWTGTAAATVNGTARTKGEVFTLPANTNVVVAFVGGTFTDVQLERGTVATPFEHRSIGQELSLCQRYYQKGRLFVQGPTQEGSNLGTSTALTVTMRGAPSVTLTVVSSAALTSGLSVQVVTSNSVGMNGVFSAASGANVIADYTASAELTS